MTIKEVHKRETKLVHKKICQNIFRPKSPDASVNFHVLPNFAIFDDLLADESSSHNESST